MTCRRPGASHPLALAALLLWTACPRPPGPAAAPAGGLPPGAAALADGGFQLSAAHLEGWLRWQRQLAALPPLRLPDGGSPGRAASLARARAERTLLEDAGLSAAEADEVEERVSAFVAERTVERLSGGAAEARLASALAELTVEQRLAAEAALAGTDAQAGPTTLERLEARLGAGALRLLLEREAELTRAWDALLDAP